MLFVHCQFRPFVEYVFSFGLRYRVYGPAIYHDPIPVLRIYKCICCHTERCFRYQFTFFLVPTASNGTCGRLSSTFHYLIGVPIVAAAQFGNGIKGFRLLHEGKNGMAIASGVLYMYDIEFSGQGGRFFLRVDFNVLRRYVF